MKLKKSLGQHLLINKRVLMSIIRAASLEKKDVVLEIGAGSGILTRALAEQVKKVIAIEIDKEFASRLNSYLKDFSNVELIFGDIRKVFPRLKLPQNYKVVANIPYYASSLIIKMLLSAWNKPKEIVCLLQKEVAERICASKGNFSILSNSVLFFGKPEIIGKVPRSAFYPPPKVDSAILKIKDINNDNARILEEKRFFQVLKAGFAAPRKTLVNNLAAGMDISKQKASDIIKSVGLKEAIRPQELTVSDWINIAQRF